jgi:hypothetical protein
MEIFAEVGLTFCIKTATVKPLLDHVRFSHAVWTRCGLPARGAPRRSMSRDGRTGTVTARSILAAAIRLRGAPLDPVAFVCAFFSELKLRVYFWALEGVR